MCVEVLVEPEGRILATVGELSAFLGDRSGIAFDGSSLTVDDGDCLCPVNLDITAAEAGYRNAPGGERNPLGVVWERV